MAEYDLLLGVAYAVPVALVIAGDVSLAVLLPLASLPLALALLRVVHAGGDPRRLNPVLRETARLSLRLRVALRGRPGRAGRWPDAHRPTSRSTSSTIPFREPIISGTQRWEQHRAGIVTLRTDDGRKGLGEFPAPRPARPRRGRLARLVEVLSGHRPGRPRQRGGHTARHRRLALRGPGRSLGGRIGAGRPGGARQRAPVACYLDTRAAADVAVNALLGMGPAGGDREPGGRARGGRLPLSQAQGR